MNTTKIYCSSLSVSFSTGPDIKDISRGLDRIVAESLVADGHLVATMIGSTGSLTTIEYEPGVVADLKAAINRLAPPDIEYAHELAWHDGNGHSHVQAALLNPAIALPVRRGKICRGTWQQAVAINHDNRPRNRQIEVSVFGILR